MNQLSLFTEKPEKQIREILPIIYRYENFNIHKKINYKTSPHLFYGSKHNHTVHNCYREPVLNRYGCNRKGLDYSTQHRNK